MKAGAPWPKTAQTADKAPEASGKYTFPERRSFWSFQPLADAKPPEVKDAKWARNEIDRFVLAQLEREGV